MAIQKFKDRVNSEDRYIVSTAGQGATITGADAGDNDVVVIDGLAASYTVKAAGHKLVIQGLNDAGKKFAVTVNFNAKTAGEVTVAFRDGSVTFDYTPKIGKVKASITMQGDEGTTPVTVVSKAFIVPVTVVNSGFTADDVANGLSVPRDDEGNVMFSLKGGSFELTIGTDTLTTTVGDDTVLATRQTLTASDNVNGLGGTDQLLIDSDGNLLIPGSSRVSNIETVSIVSAGSVNGKMAGTWTGVETLTISANGDVKVSSDASTVVIETAAADDDIVLDDVNAITVEVRAGEGDNTVDLNLGDSEGASLGRSGGAGSILVETGAGTDSIAIDSDDAADVLIRAGNGDNDLDLDLGYGSSTDISTGSGNDVINVIARGEITVQAGAGNNEINISDAFGGVNVQAGAGNDTVDLDYIGGASVKVGAGNNTVTALYASDLVIEAGAGNDRIEVDYAGAVEVKVGGGTNSVDIGYVGSVTVTAGAGDDTIVITDAEGYVDVAAGDGNNTVTITDVEDSVDVTAGNGNNTIAIDDVEYDVDVTVGNGNNTITITDAEDSVDVTAGDGNNIITMTDVDYFVDVIAGDGNNTIAITDAEYDVDVTVGDGNNTITITDVEDSVDVTAGNGNNTIAITDVEDYVDVTAGNGKNTITITNAYSGGSVAAGAGDDTISVNNDDLLFGDDYVYIAAGAGTNSVEISSVYHAEVSAGAGDDSIVIANADSAYVYAGDGDNTVTVSDISGSAFVETGSGDDIITVDPTVPFVSVSAGAGDDTVTVGAGFETIDLGSGENTLILNLGYDQPDLSSAAAQLLAAELSNDIGGNLNHLVLNAGINLDTPPLVIEFSPESDAARLQSLTVGDIYDSEPSVVVPLGPVPGPELPDVVLAGVAADFTLTSTGRIGDIDGTVFDDGWLYGPSAGTLNLLITNATGPDSAVLPQTLTISAADDLNIGLISAGGPFASTLDDVTVSADGNAQVQLSVLVADEGPDELGDVSVTGGDTAALELTVIGRTGALTAGDISVSADGAAGLALATFADALELEFGDIAVTGGSQAALLILSGYSGRLELGAVTLETTEAPAVADAAYFLGSEDSVSDASFGLGLSVDPGQSLEFAMQGLSMDSAGSAGADLYLDLSNGAEASIVLGAIDVAAAADAFVDLVVDAEDAYSSSVNLTASSITVSSADAAADVEIAIEIDSEYADIDVSLGDITVSAATDASVDLELDASSDYEGSVDLTIGDITVSSESADAGLDIGIDAYYAAYLDASVTLGDVTLSGDTATLDMSNWDLDADEYGYLAVKLGDISLTATSTAVANGDKNFSESASLILGGTDGVVFNDYLQTTIELGDVDMTAAAGAELFIGNIDADSSHASVTVTVGDISLSTGQDASVVLDSGDDVYVDTGDITITADGSADIYVNNNQDVSLGDISVTADNYDVYLDGVYGTESISLGSTSNLLEDTQGDPLNTVGLHDLYDLKTLTLGGKGVEATLGGSFHELETIDLTGVSTYFELDLDYSAGADISSTGEALFINVGVADGNIDLSSLASQDVVAFTEGTEATNSDIGSVFIHNFDFDGSSTSDYIDLTAFGFEADDVIVTEYTGIEGNGYFIDFADLSLGSITVVGDITGATAQNPLFLLGIQPEPVIV